MKLSQIAELKPLIVGGDAEIEFSGISCDSRLVRRGDIFAAVEGWKEDGTRYIAAALERGAAGILSQRDPRLAGGRCLQVSDVRLALALTAAAANDWPARRMDVYAVTGTNGKTTTAWLLFEMLKGAGRSAGLFSTVSIVYAGREIPATRTTPDACALQRLLAEMRLAGCDASVMECSSHALHQRRVAGIPFAGGIFTNLSRDHLDYHRSMDDYFDAKLLMFRQMADLNPGAPAVCCVDSDYGVRMAEAVRALPLTGITVGFAEDADLRISALKTDAVGNRFVLNGLGAEMLDIHTALAGRYNLQNIACAAALAAATGVAWEAVAAAVEAARPRWGRLERVSLQGCAFSAFVDYAHTDDALKNVLSTLREITAGRLIVVFGCGGDRDRSKRPLMGAVCAALADTVVVTSDNPRYEDPQSIIREILEGIDATAAAVQVCPDRREAIRAALHLAQPGDVLLVAGKGHECFQEYAGRSVVFDDRLVLAEEAARL
jgi:UDP-N-acetylmuramoyl-L-alanyl-D-glutamate--2,6-diaminopimelate ligase